MKLYPYQLEGIRFLKDRSCVLLADDTGVGKTIQAIKACQELRTRTLVVCPNSLKYQWVDEIAKWTNLSYLVINGKTDYGSSDAEFYIINYERVLSELDQINALPFDCIILDEAQRIRNPRAKTTKLVKKLRRVPYRFLLTATPVENYISDLYSLLEFLGSKVVQDIESTLMASRGGYTGYVKVSGRQGTKTRLRRMITHAKPKNLEQALTMHMLRRKKDEVNVNFPPKVVNTIYTELTPVQKKMYSKARDELLLMIDDKGIPIPNILAKITYLREICDSTQLINPKTKSSYKLQELLPLVQEIVDGGHKVVIFSEFRRMTDIILSKLTDVGIKCSYLRGGMKPKEIQAEKRRFKTVTDVCICTKTGELGHNLDAASYVIDFEPPFNPARLKQRDDRVHRITQKNKVFVYNFITRDTYEIRMKEILYRKKELFETVIDRKTPYREHLKSIIL